MSAGTFLNASVGAYRLVDFLGAGGMGEVYRGIDPAQKRVVAIKVLSTGGQAGSLLERFKNEARIHATLQHPNVVALYDFLDLGGRPCIVMEYVDGETLDQRVHREGPLEAALALAWFEQIGGAVAYLHARGIVHRDLKANNIKLTPSGQIKLLDFGLARNAATPKLTATGHVVGTLEYMAPEQLAQQTTDERSDIWALGVVLYEMVTGRLPFDAQNIGDLMRRIVMADYFPASTVAPALPRSIDAIIASCLKRNPDDRVASVDGLLGMVRTVLARLRRESLPAGPIQLVSPSRWDHILTQLREVTTSRRLRGGVAVLGLALIATIGVALSRPGPKPLPAPAPTPAPIPIPAPVPASVTPNESGSPDLTRCGLATSTTPADSVREITIDVLGGWADVRCETTVLGRTPATIRIRPGIKLRLWLTRPAFQDTLVDFTPTWNTTGMQYQMQHQSDPAKGTVALFGWLPFGLFGRRKRAGQSSQGARPTNEIPAVGGGNHVVVSVLSDVGCVRDSNEDSIGFCRPLDLAERERAGVLLIVADGMGGHSAGEVASRLAVETVVTNYATDNGDPQAALTRAVKLANRTIHDAARSDQSRAGMGTTCTVLLIKQGLAYCAHVGDSRLYLFRDRSALQMTEDHSAVFDLVKRGVIDRDAARSHPDRNVIIRALGSRPEIEVAQWPKPLFVRHADRFLVSSDGLHDLVSDEELTEIVLGKSPDNACRELVAVAKSRGGHDNISVGILAVSDDAPTMPMATTLPREDGAS